MNYFLNISKSTNTVTGYQDFEVEDSFPTKELALASLRKITDLYGYIDYTLADEHYEYLYTIVGTKDGDDLTHQDLRLIIDAELEEEEEENSSPYGDYQTQVRKYYNSTRL